MPHTNGPASRRPDNMSIILLLFKAPTDTTPHKKAHIGGNQVTGFISSRSDIKLGVLVK
jgi:hypothetical protein